MATFNFPGRPQVLETFYFDEGLDFFSYLLGKQRRLYVQIEASVAYRWMHLTE